MSSSAPPVASLAKPRALLALLVALLAAGAVAIAVTSSTAATPGSSAFSTISWKTAASQPFANSEAQGEVVGDKLYVFGGFDSQKGCCTPTNRAYSYEPATDTWTPLANMPGQRPNGSSTAAAYPGGVTHAGFAHDSRYVYWAGGYISDAAGTGQTFGTNEVWRYDTQANTYTKLANLPKRTSAVQAEVVGTTLHVFGGTTADSRAADFNDHFTLDLGTSGAAWQTRNDTSKLTARHHMGSAVVGTKIYAIGGQSAHDEQLTTRADVQAFDTAAPAQGWQSAAPLPRARGHISNSTFAYGGRIFAMGGETANGAHIADVSVYDPQANSWSDSTALPAARVSGVAGAIGGRFLFTTGGGSAVTYVGAPGNVPGACGTVSELPCAQVGRGLPIGLDFTGAEGGLYDAQGQDIGFTMVQPNSTGGYRPERLDVTGGDLRIRTTPGINYRTAGASGANNPNSLDNGVGVGVDASKALRIQTTVVRPALGSGSSEQAAVWFGPDQDNYVKVDLASTNAAQPYQRPQVVWEINGTPTEINLENDLSRNHSNQNVKLILETDPVSRTVTGALTVDGGGRQVIGTTGALPASWFAAPNAPQGSGYAGVFATHRLRAATLGALTYTFSDFTVNDLTPDATAPNMVVTDTRLVVSDPVNPTGGLTKQITVENTGGGALTLQAPTIADDAADPDDDAGHWSAANGTTTIAPGSTGTVNVTFNPTSTGVKGAYLTVRSNDPDAPTAQVKLRGLAHPGFTGGNEPSLQRILDTYEIPVSAGDTNPESNAFDGPTPPVATAAEVAAQRFERAGAGAVSVEPLAVFGPDSHTPLFRLGWNPAGATTPENEIFNLPYDTGSNRESQRLDVPGGIRTFDPGSAPFSTHSIWPAFNNRRVYQEDALNGWDGNNKHKVRVYPYRTPAGVDVANAYVVAIEETLGGGDYQDLVFVLRNVRPVTRVASGEVETTNLDGVPYDDRLVMNRIQTPDATTPNGVHDQATVRVRNTHATQPLAVSGVQLSDTTNWQLVTPPSLPREIAPGGSVDVTVKFVATTPSGNPANRQFNGRLDILTSDADEPVLPVELSGMWQRQSENNTEPDVAQITQSFGYGTTILRSGQQLNNKGELVKIGDEVQSQLWKRADTTKAVTVRQLAAFHTQGNTATFGITRTNSTTRANKLTHYGVDGQSYLPRLNSLVGGVRPLATASFTPTAAETGTSTGTDPDDGLFNINIDGENSDWTKNNANADVDCRAKQETDPAVVCGQHVRTWPVKDRTGKLVKNQWLVSMDYSGINYDFNDNVYLVENIRPRLDADDPAIPKPCTPVACEKIAVATPFSLDFSSAKADSYLDKDDQGTGFTQVSERNTGSGYVKANIDLDTAASRLKLTTTPGLAVTGTNTQDNLLGVGLKWGATTKKQMITTRIADVPSPSGGFEQAGLWFGLGQDDYVKIHVWSDATGSYQVESVAEVGGALQAPVGSSTAAGVKTSRVDVIGKAVDLKLVADPATRRVSAYYTLQGGGEQLVATWLAPATFFASDPGAYDERVGTNSFAGIATSHRNATAPLTYQFDSFGVAEDTTVERPRVTASRPANGDTNVPLDVTVATDLSLPHSGVDANSIHVDVDSVRLINADTNARVAGSTGTSGGFDTITFAPSAKLAPSTRYRFEITDAAKDQSGNRFEPYSATFTTGSGSTSTTEASFDKLAQANAVAPEYLGFTSLAVGPDRKLYGLRNDGLIQRWAIGADGALGQAQNIRSLQSGGERLGIGLVFDPSSTAANPIAWVTHSTLGFDNMPDWGGKITRLSGADLQNAQDVVVGLPRSAKDHVTNGVSFGPDGKLYFPQGSNSAMGRADSTWRNRDERLLTGAVLQLDPAKLPANLPINVQTEELAAGQTAYDPYAANAPLSIYATGVRNAFDLLWHSNGSMYVPTNGSAAGGNTPAEPATMPAACANRINGQPYTGAAGTKPSALTNVTQTQPDWLFRVVKGGYYGHPNPKRCEWVLNGGNPTASDDKGQVNGYPVGTQPDPNWRRDQAFLLGLNKSPNGVTEYKSDLFGGSLKGKILVTHYSNDDDVFAYTAGPNGEIVPGSGQVVKGVENFIDPLDVVEDPQTGNLYVSQYDQLGADVPKVFLMKARTTEQPATDCPPLSTLRCSQIRVGTNPAYEPSTGGLADKDNQGTGFTMVQPNGASGDTPAYKPENLDVAGERLTITATQGIQYKSASTGGTGQFNALENGLGVGIAGDRKLRLETTLVNPPLLSAANSEQGGLWLGPDQDNYVKLVVANATAGNVVHHRVQLLREQAGASAGTADPATTDELNVPATAPTQANRPDFSSQRVRLILEVDPATKIAEAWYQAGTGAVNRVGQLTVSDAIVNASRIAAAQRSLGIGNYAGIFATKRNNTGTAPVQFAFEDTSIGEAEVPNRAPQVDALEDRSSEQGVPASIQVRATDPDNDSPLAYSATGLPEGVSIDAGTGLISGTPTRTSQEAAEVTVRVTDPEGLAGTETFRWTITAPFKPVVDELKVNFTSKTGTAVAGYRNDAGQAYGDKATDLRYGWVGVNDAGNQVTHQPLDLSIGGTANAGNGRERNIVTTDERLDSLMHLQGDDVQAFEQAKPTPGTFNGTPREGAWELALADGRYDVTVAAGDPAAYSSTSAPEQHFLRVEGTPAWPSPLVLPNAAGAGRTQSATLRDVRVTDGRLTIDAIGGVNTKILYVDVARVANATPTLEPVADRSSREGEAVTLQLVGADADDDDLTYTATGLPAGLAVDPDTGRIAGTIGANASASSPYAVTARVDDGTASATRSFSWTVTEADAPSVTTVTPAENATEVAIDTDVTARFSEGVSVTAAQFTLRRGDVAVDAALSYDAASNTAKLDPAQPLERNATYTATVKGGADGVVDGSGNRMGADRTWSFSTVSTCGVYSTLPCADVDRPLDHEIDFSGERAGTLAKTGGFTMSQPQGQTSPVSSYKPELLTLENGLLKVNTTIGIQYKNAANAPSGDWNKLDNGLGIGFTQPNRTMRFQTTVVPQVPASATTSSEQAGVWFGPDQDNYVKAVLVGSTVNGARQWRVQMAREVNGASGTPDEVNHNLGATVNGTTPVQIRLDVDPRGGGRATASYRVGTTGAWLPVGSATASLAVPASILDGTSLPSALRSAGTTQTAGLMATKRGRTATGDFVWAFDDWSASVPNTAPVITGAVDQADDAGAKVEITTIKATDAEGDPITWSATGLPGTLAIDPATGAITGRLPSAPGTANVTVTATSTGDKSESRTFAWTWSTAPTPAGLGDGFKVDFGTAAMTPETGYVGDHGQVFGTRSGQRFGWVRAGSNTPLDLSVGGTAGNGRLRSCADLAPRMRSLMHMQGDDPANFNGTPIEGAWEIAVPDGRYRVKAGVGDPTAGVDAEIDVINAEGQRVVGPNSVPAHTAGGPAPCLATNQAEGEAAVTVADGRLTLDAAGGTNTKILYVDITPIANRAPVLPELANRSDDQGATVSLDAGATDADGDTLEYSAEGLPEGLSIDGDDGRINGTITEAPGVNRVTVRVIDRNGGVDTAEFDWTVTDGDAPTVTAVDPADGAAGVATTVTPRATFSEPIAAGTGTFRLYRGTVEIAGTTQLNAARTEATFTPSTPLLSATAYRAVVAGAEDAAGNALAAERAWTFTTVNRAPALGNPGAQSAREGSAFTLDLDAVESDEGQTVAYTATGLPAGLTIARDTGVISGTPAAGTARTAPYSVTVTATDSFTPPASDSETFALTVVEGSAPTVTGVSPQGGALDVPVGENVTATFSEPVRSGSVTFTLRRGDTAVPAALTLSGDRRTATLDPSAPLDHAAQYTASVTAGQDDAGNDLGAPRTWTFTTLNRAPVVDAPANTTIRQDESVDLDADATDPDGHGVTFSAAGLPAGVAIDPQSGAITGRPAAAGTSEITVRATDDFAAAPKTGTATFTLTVTETTPVSPTVRVNMAGPAQTVGSVEWDGCTSAASCGGGTMTGGSAYDNNFTVSSPIAPANARVYREEWTGGQTTGVPAGGTAFTWNRALPNGSYVLRLHFNEHNQRAAGLRRFDVNVEGGATELPDFDLFVAAGGADRPYVREIPVTVADGQLNVAFIRRVQNALINGIEVIPAGPDTTRPVATITGGPADGSTTTSTSAQFTFTSNESGGAFRCKLDSGAEAACTSPRSLSGLATGEHTFTVVAVDAAGNESAPVTRRWTVVAPERPTVRVNMAGPAQTVGSTAWAACTSPSACGGGTVSGGFQVDNNVTVTSPIAPANARVYREEWTGGQTNGVPAGGTAFTWNRALPNGRYRVRLHLNEHNQRAAGRRVFDVNVEGGATEIAGLDVFSRAGGAGRPHVEEMTTDVADGQLNVAFVRRVENAMVNGIEVIPVTTPTGPDTTKPVVAITGGPANGSSSSSTNAEFTFTANESAAFACALDGGEPAACTSPRAYTGLGTGSHTFTVRATDAAGNVSDPVTRTWSVTSQPSDPRQPIRVNMAGPAQTVGSATWAACTSAASCGGGTVVGGFVYDNNFTVSSPIAPANTRVYREEWTGGQTNGVPAGGTAFTFNRAVANGRWTVRLHFNEHNQRAVGLRRFDVNVEGGATELPNLDVFQQAGGADRPIVREITTDVTDGTMNVAFIRRVENAMVNGIELIPVAAQPAAAAGGSVERLGQQQQQEQPAAPAAPGASRAPGKLVATPAPKREDGVAGSALSASDLAVLPLRLDLAGRGATVGGLRFAACAGSWSCGGILEGGGPFAVGSRSRPAKMKGRARLHATVWAGVPAKNGRPRTSFAVNIPVAKPGVYRFRMHFAEPQYDRRGRRIFDVNLEGGKAEVSRLDIFRTTGARHRPMTRTITARVTDGVANIAFVSRRERAVLSALEVLPG